MDNDVVLATLHNSAATYQRMGHLAECANYLDGCLYNTKNRQVFEAEENSDKG